MLLVLSQYWTRGNVILVLGIFFKILSCSMISLREEPELDKMDQLKLTIVI